MNAVLKPRQPRTVIYTEVEHEISEWETEDLEAELLRRGKETPNGYGVSVDELFNAMAFRNHKLALELLRDYLMNVTGRILP